MNRRRRRLMGINGTPSPPAPWTPNALGGQLVTWINPPNASTVTGSPVSAITDPRTTAFTTPPRYLSQQAGNRPAYTGGRLVFDGTNNASSGDYMDGGAGYNYVSATTLPAAGYSEPGKGFTCTGLARNGDGTWWIGNFGKLNETTAGTETFQGGLCRVSADFSTLLQEITFASLSLANVGIQGIGIDTTNGYLYCADVQNSRIYGIDPAGPTLVYNFAYTNANALTYNSITNELLVCGDNVRDINRVNKTTGATIGLLFRSRDDTNPDHMFFDASYGSAGALYVTSRTNHVSGRVIKYDLAAPNALRAWFIDEVRTIEGVVVVGDTIYLCDDEYYHNATAGVNRIVRVTAETATPDLGTRLIMSGVVFVSGTLDSTGEAVFTGSDGIGQKGAGVYFNNTAPGQIRIICRAGGPQATADFNSATTTTTEFIFVVDVNMVTNKVNLYINGTFFGEVTQANFTGSIPSLVWTLSASYEHSGLGRWSPITLGGVIVTTNPNERERIEGYLAWQTGNQGLLPGGHPYKSVAP